MAEDQEQKYRLTITVHADVMATDEEILRRFMEGVTDCTFESQTGEPGENNALEAEIWDWTFHKID